MKKMINNIFVYAYTWHYERNNNDPRIDPTGIASGILGLCVCCWFIAINVAFSFLFNYDSKSYKLISITAAVSLIASGLFNSYYLDNNRAMNLYTEYKSSPSVKRPFKGILYVIFFTMIPFILLIIFMFIFNLVKNPK